MNMQIEEMSGIDTEQVGGGFAWLMLVDFYIRRFIF